MNAGCPATGPSGLNGEAIMPAQTESLGAGPAGQHWRQGKLLVVGEMAIVLLIFVAAWYHLIPFSNTPFLFLLGWFSLRLRKSGWKDVGLRQFRSWRATLAYGLVGGICLELLQLFVTQPLLVSLTGKPPDLEGFRPLTGNVKL